MGVTPPAILEDDFSIISAPLDFLGVNYSSRMLVRGRTDSYEAVERIPGASYTEMGWEVFPAGLANILKRIHPEYAPKALFVTESGAAFNDHLDATDNTPAHPPTATLRPPIH